MEVQKEEGGEGEGDEDIFENEAKEEGPDFVSANIDRSSQGASSNNGSVEGVQNQEENGRRVESGTNNGDAVVVCLSFIGSFLCHCGR